MAFQKAAPFARAARAAGTRRVYAQAWKDWAAWCALMHTAPLPAAPETIAAYLAERARSGKSVATVNVALSAILHGHREAGHELPRAHPALRAVLAGIKRRTARPIRRAAALEIADLRRIIAGIDDTRINDTRINDTDLRALRDRALLLVAFFGALRRSEVTSLDVTGRSPIAIRDEGLLLNLTATKTTSETQTIAIPRRGDELCAVSAVEAYLAAAGIVSGPLFRAVSKAGRLLTRRLAATSVRHILTARAGTASGFTPHSLRAGFITSAAKANAPEYVIQRTSRHKSVDVLRSYMRDADAFGTSAAGYL